MLRDELRDILRHLATAVGATSAQIVRGDAPAVGARQDHEPGRRSVPLGHGATLVVELEIDRDDTAAAVERAARAVRAAARRWQVETLPALALTATHQSPRDRIFERMRTFLSAFCGSSGADVACVVRHGSLLATSSPLDPLQNDRLSFIVRLAEAEARKKVGTSHATVFGDDYMAATFYYDAVLIAFVSAPMVEDFMRHHARSVCRELIVLLELVDDGPPDPAHTAPVS